MTAVDPSGLRPDIRAEVVRLGGGHTVTVYRCPYPSQGPVRVGWAAGGWAVRFMYAHFVFTWPRGAQGVDIAHGTLDRSLPLWQSVPVPGEWGEQALSRFGRWWVQRQRHHHHRRGLTIALLHIEDKPRAARLVRRPTQPRPPPST